MESFHLKSAFVQHALPLKFIIFFIESFQIQSAKNGYFKSVQKGDPLGQHGVESLRGGVRQTPPTPLNLLVLQMPEFYSWMFSMSFILFHRIFCDFLSFFFTMKAWNFCFLKHFFVGCFHFFKGSRCKNAAQNWYWKKGNFALVPLLSLHCWLLKRFFNLKNLSRIWSIKNLDQEKKQEFCISSYNSC